MIKQGKHLHAIDMGDYYLRIVFADSKIYQNENEIEITEMTWRNEEDLQNFIADIKRILSFFTINVGDFVADRLGIHKVIEKTMSIEDNIPVLEVYLCE